MSKIETINRKFGLDLARALAISMVLLAHFSHKNLDLLGFYGVNLFFGLSGYLIGQIIWKQFSEKENWSMKHIYNFWQRRWWRTLPNYYFFLLILIILSIFLSEYFGKLPDFKELIYYFFFIQYFTSHSFGFYSVSWSLCIEEWFYLSFPLSLFAVNFFIKGNKPTVFITTIFLFIFCSLLIKLYYYYNMNNLFGIGGITIARLDTITFGVLLAFVNKKYFIKTSNLLLLFGLGTLLIFLPILYWIMIRGNTLVNLVNLPIFLTLTPLGFSLMLPWLEQIVVKQNFFVFSITKISLWSYSIYLSHSILMWFFYHYVESIRNSTIGNLISKILALSLTLLISAFLYRYLEVPFVHKRPKEI